MKLLFLIFTTLSIVACTNLTPTTEVASFKIEKYKGYVIVSVLENQYNYNKDIIIKNDTCIKKVTVPSWFFEVYRVKDTIK